MGNDRIPMLSNATKNVRWETKTSCRWRNIVYEARCHHYCIEYKRKWLGVWKIHYRRSHGLYFSPTWYLSRIIKGSQQCNAFTVLFGVLVVPSPPLWWCLYGWESVKFYSSGSHFFKKKKKREEKLIFNYAINIILKRI